MTAALFTFSTVADAQLSGAIGGLGQMLQQFDINSVLTKARTPDQVCERLVDAPDVAESGMQLAGIVAMARSQMGSGRNILKDKRITDTAKSLLWVPIDYERGYAADVHKMRLAENTALELKDLSPAERRQFRVAENVLSALVTELPQDQPYRYRLFVSGDDGQNAEALPGGYIYVTRSALDGGEKLLAALLAHEVSHVSKRHYSRRLQARMVDVVNNGEDLIGLLRGDRNIIQRIGQQAQQREKQGVRFSVNQELEADACAVRLIATQSGIDPQASVNAFLSMLQQEGAATRPNEGGACEAFGDCHPSYREREQTMRGMVARSSMASRQPRDLARSLTAQPAATAQPSDASNGDDGPKGSAPAVPDLGGVLRGLGRMFDSQK
jgi:hypothetical protein